MKKLNKIKLHDLSKDEIANKELNMLRGGSGRIPCGCITVCSDSICACYEKGSGSFPTTWDDSNSAPHMLDFYFSNGDALVNSTNDNIGNRD